VRQVGYQQEFV